MSKVVQQVESNLQSMRVSAEFILMYSETMNHSLTKIKATILLQKIDALEVALLSTLQNYKDAQ
jgi:hypothetical protein